VVRFKENPFSLVMFKTLTSGQSGQFDVSFLRVWDNGDI